MRPFSTVQAGQAGAGGTPSPSTQQLAAGGASLSALRGNAAKDPKGTIQAVAQQFEALFMQELMKSMRSTTMADGMLENQGTAMGTEMLDQQYAMELSGRPGGLAQAIARQLERQMGVGTHANGAGAAGSGGAGVNPVLMPLRRSTVGLSGLSGQLGQVGATGRAGVTGLGPQAIAESSREGAVRATDNASAQEFIQQHDRAARTVAAQSGIPAEFMLAQAAHETGWGRREIRGNDGSNAYNLFGIKAGAGWNGPSVTITTTEVIDGQPRKVQARFRAYASYEESFRDYARLIGGNARYADVPLDASDPAGFARGLQRAGYATDPAYAAKLTRVIQTTQRLQRSLGRADIGAQPPNMPGSSTG